MSKNIVRQYAFGEDIRVIHEIIEMGRKVGADSHFYAKLACDEYLFRRVVALVRGEPLEDHLREATQVLQAAVRKGVSYEDGVYKFFDPGIPLIVLRDLPIVRDKKLMAYQDIYGEYAWARANASPRYRYFRLPVDGSDKKCFGEQVQLLGPNEVVPSVRSVASFVIIAALATDTYHLGDSYVRCLEKPSDGKCVMVGSFGPEGFYIHEHSDDFRNSTVALAAERNL